MATTTEPGGRAEAGDGDLCPDMKGAGHRIAPWPAPFNE
jgi:hypothetical protein